VAVQGVVDKVALAALEPFEKRRIGVVQDLVPFFEPVQVGGLFLPEETVVGVREIQGGLELGLAHVGLAHHLGQGAEYALLPEQAIDETGFHA